jgi:hypothetical protein
MYKEYDVEHIFSHKPSDELILSIDSQKLDEVFDLIKSNTAFASSLDFGK